VADPKGSTEGTRLSKARDLILNAEDQTWRSGQGLTPTDDGFADTSSHTSG